MGSFCIRLSGSFHRPDHSAQLYSGIKRLLSLVTINVSPNRIKNDPATMGSGTVTKRLPNLVKMPRTSMSKAAYTTTRRLPTWKERAVLTWETWAIDHEKYGQNTTFIQFCQTWTDYFVISVEFFSHHLCKCMGSGSDTWWLLLCIHHSAEYNYIFAVYSICQDVLYFKA